MCRQFTIRLLVVVSAVALLTIGRSEAQQWYGSSGPVPLSVDSAKILVKFSVDVGETEQGEVISPLASTLMILSDQQTVDEFVFCSLLAVVNLDWACKYFCVSGHDVILS